MRKVEDPKGNKKKYDLAYQKANVKSMAFVLNRNTDQDIIEFLATKENRNAYLKALIRADMHK